MSKYQDLSLGDLFQISSGGTPSRNHNEYYDNGDIPWVKTGDLKYKYLFEAGEFITEEGIKNSSAKIYPVDTVLLAMYGATIGACSILKIPAATNQACAAFVKNEKVLPDYLYLCLESKKQFFVEAGVGGAQPNISVGFLKGVKIQIPPIEEQRKIAEILDNVSNLISLRKKQIEKLDLLVKSRFVEMFKQTDYEEKELISLIKKGAGLSYGIVVPGENSEDGIPMIRPVNYENDKINLDDLYRVDKEIEVKYAKTRLTGNEILVTVIGSNMGQIMLTNSSCGGMNVTRNLAVVRQEDRLINKYYLKEYLLSEKGQKYLMGQVNTSTIKQLPLAKLKQMPVNVPPLELQNQFAEFVQQVDKQKLILHQGLAKLELNYKALMQRHFG